MFNSLMAWGMKLLHSLAVWACMLLYLLPDGKSGRGVCGVLHNAGGFVGAACGVNVHDGGERHSDDFFCCPHYPLQDLVV